MNNICDSDNLDKCGVPSSFTTMAGTNMVFPKKLSELNPKLITSEITSVVLDVDKSTTDTNVAAFETVNGESIAVFYNPNCKNDQETGGNIDAEHPDWGDWLYTQNKMCVNFIYDLNGLKGPNKVGRDIGFITALYSKNSEVVAPVPFNSDASKDRCSQLKAIELCANYSDNSRLPNKHEMSSLFYNMNLIGNFKIDSGYWSSSVVSSDYGWHQAFNLGNRRRGPRDGGNYVRCIEK